MGLTFGVGSSRMSFLGHSKMARRGLQGLLTNSIYSCLSRASLVVVAVVVGRGNFVLAVLLLLLRALLPFLLCRHLVVHCCWRCRRCCDRCPRSHNIYSAIGNGSTRMCFVLSTLVDSRTILRDAVADLRGTSLYVVMLGGYRVFYALNWIYKKASAGLLSTW